MQNELFYNSFYISTLFRYLYTKKRLALETQQILKALKLILKNKKMNYTDLSNQLGLSESGLKKMMTSNDISIHRLNKICQIIDISMIDLLKLSQTQVIENIEFTDRQTALLLKDSFALMIFWMLTIERKSPLEIKKSEKISAADFQKILYKLESVDLINTKGQITATHKGLYRWGDSSPLVQKMNSEWSKLTLEKSLKKSAHHFHRLSYVQITKKDRDKIIEKISDLMNEIANLHQSSKYEKNQDQLVPLSIVIASTGSGFFDRD